MFLTEQELKDTFWKNYNYSGRAIRCQFESSIREGNADLVTVEMFQNNVQFNSFEFKLSDIKKAIVQAEHNSKYVHKSWIVIPEEKKKLIQDKYTNILNEIKYVGVITVEEGGKWTMIHRPFYRNKVELNQEILKLMLLKF